MRRFGHQSINPSRVKMKLKCLPKPCCCFRRCSGLGVLVLIVLLASISVFILTEDSVILERSEITTAPLWILPAVTSSHKAFQPTIPENWTVYVPKGYRNITRCVACVHEDDSFFTRMFSKMADSISIDSSSPSTTLPKNNMARLLFVIQHGATGILMTSDLQSTNTTMSRLILDDQPDGVVGIEYASQGLVSDSFHFHHRPVASRENPCKHYRFRKRMKPLWTVGVTCRTASVSSPDTNTKTSVLLDPHAPPVFSSKPKFSIERFSDAFFDYEGFWALFASIFPEAKRTTRWALWAQRMLQEIRGDMALTSLTCPSGKLPSTSIEDTPDKMVKAMHSFITSWTCAGEMAFYHCAKRLAKDLSSANFVESQDLKLLDVWLNGLRNSGYPEPRRVVLTTDRNHYLPGCVIYSPALVRAVPNRNKDNSGNNNNSKDNKNNTDDNKYITTQQITFPSIYPLCKNLQRRPDVVYPFGGYEITKPSKAQDIALVIIFYDSSIYSNIRFLQDLYSNYFPYLIYCGPDWKLFVSFYKTFQKPLTYIEVPNTKGFVAYECVSRAIMMNYDVSGYLEMADDVILNTWTLGRVPRDKFWFQKDLKIASRYQQIMPDFALPYPFPWWPWTVHGQMWGAKAMAKVWREFGHILQSTPGNSTRTKQIVTAFLNTLRHNSGNSENFFYCSSDIFYVPSKFRQEWTWLSEMFFSSNVFLDIAVPTLMNGMDETGNIVRMEGIYLWYDNRGNYPAYYRDFHQFFHPWKMGWIQRSDHANFLCYHVLPHIVTDRTDAVIETNMN